MTHKLPQHVISLTVVYGLSETSEHEQFIEAFYGMGHKRPCVHPTDDWAGIDESFPFIDDESRRARGTGGPYQCGALCVCRRKMWAVLCHGDTVRKVPFATT
jgi:hypothetical protein